MDKKIHRPDPGSVKVVMEVFMKHSEKVKMLYTIGYGGTWTKRITKTEFQERLWLFQEEVGKRLAIVDIRKLNSKSLNGKWFYHSGHYQFGGMCQLVYDMGRRNMYFDAHVLSNSFNGSVAGLKSYRWWIKHCSPPYEVKIFQQVLRLIDSEDYAVILLCAELKPFNKSGSPRCHRIPLGLELLEMLGDGWEVKHL